MDALKEGGRGGTAGVGQNRTRGLLVISEVALALVALVGTAARHAQLSGRALDSPGIRRALACCSRSTTSTHSLPTTPRAYDSVCVCATASRTLPGIAAVSFSDDVPLELGTRSITDITVEGYTPAANEQMGIASAIVAPHYFDVLRIPLMPGERLYGIGRWRPCAGRDGQPRVRTTVLQRWKPGRTQNPRGRSVGHDRRRGRGQQVSPADRTANSVRLYSLSPDQWRPVLDRVLHTHRRAVATALFRRSNARRPPSTPMPG